MNPTSPADRYESVEAAIAEGVLWREHDHRPRPCCTKAMLDAIPDGWAKVDGEWIRVEVVAVDKGDGTIDADWGRLNRELQEGRLLRWH